MSHTTKDTFSNSKVKVDLPLTQDLFPTGTTLNNAGKPLVYHPQAGKMSIGEFPTPDGSYLRYRTITAGQVQDVYNDPDVPSFLPGWVYAVQGQNPGLIVMQAVGARSLDVKNAWQVTQVPQQGGGSVEVANPVFYDVSTDTITPRVIDDSNYAKLNQGNQFNGRQVIREPNVAGETTIAGTSVEIRADNSGFGYGKLRVQGIDNQGIFENALVLDSPHVQVLNSPVLGKDVVNLDFLNQTLSGFTGGDTITDFTRSGNTLVLTTKTGTFELDLNETTYGAAANLLADSDFQVPFVADTAYGPGGYWCQNGGWTQAPGQAIGTNGSYLFQDYYPTTAQLGDYVVRVVIDSINSYQLTLTGHELPTTTFTLPGTYEVPVTLNQTGLHRIHLFGNGLFNGVVSSVSLIASSSILQRPYGYELFVHKEGVETVRGNKTFADAMVITNNSLSSNKPQTLTVTDNAASITNSFIANFLSPNITDNIFLTLGTQAGQNGQSGLFGFSKEGGIPAVFMTVYGRPASDFKILGTNGNVGMGTSTPSQKLTIVDSSSEIRLGAGTANQTPTVSVMNYNTARA